MVQTYTFLSPLNNAQLIVIIPNSSYYPGVHSSLFCHCAGVWGNETYCTVYLHWRSSTVSIGSAASGKDQLWVMGAGISPPANNCADGARGLASERCCVLIRGVGDGRAVFHTFGDTKVSPVRRYDIWAFDDRGQVSSPGSSPVYRGNSEPECDADTCGTRHLPVIPVCLLSPVSRKRFVGY